MDRWLQRLSVFTTRTVIALAVLTGVYAAAYLVVLDNRVYRHTGVDPTTKVNLYDVEPQYHFRSSAVKRTLGLAHRIDRALREGYWTTIRKADGSEWRNPAADAP